MTLPLPKSTVTAPNFADNPARWAIWYLQHNAHVYQEFRRRVVEMADARPGVALSADQVLHVIRWDRMLKAEGDLVAINNNLSSLYARLFVIEFPQYKGVFSLRRSVWDDLPEREWSEVLAAFHPVRLSRRYR